ncbi:MAG: hypothetical protein K5868_02640 [Lachnospiraceae bacterium]|nr:hypothetical protein [Lachnospiraceae bacterium]
MISKAKRTKLRNRIWQYVTLRREFWNVPRAIKGCRKIARNDKDRLHVLICDHIGDFIYTMGYMDALLKQTGYANVTIYVTEKFASMTDLFPGYKGDIQVINRHELYNLLLIDSTWHGIQEYKRLDNLIAINPTNAFTCGEYGYIAKFHEIHFGDCIRYGCLHLKKDARFVAPTVPTEADSGGELSTAHYDMTNTVIIMPYARYLNDIGNETWEKVTDALTSVGYKVYTSIGSEDEVPVNGTIPFLCSLKELMVFAPQAKMVIGTRSGLFDLLAYTESRLIAVYPTGLSDISFHSMEALPDSKAKYYEYEETTIREMIKDRRINELFL